MDALHAAIAAYLRAQREQRQRRACAIEDRILTAWRERWAGPPCARCGRTLVDGDGRWREEWACLDCSCHLGRRRRHYPGDDPRDGSG